MDDLDIDLRERLERRKGDWRGIAVRADVSYSWLCKFGAGKIDSPGYGMLKSIRAVLDEDDAQQIAFAAARSAARTEKAA